MLKRLNRHCAYFPCHRGLEDCTFCYCPFYPCQNTHLGNYIITKDKRKLWSCESCNWIHKKRVVDNIFTKISQGGLNAHLKLCQPNLAKTGVIILGHGSKLKKANHTLYQVAKAIVARASDLNTVEPAYLQLAQPDLEKVIKKLVDRGCKRVIIVPFFLFMGNHVSRDIPRAIQKASRIYPEVKFIYAKTLSHDPRINDIVMHCIREAARCQKSS